MASLTTLHIGWPCLVMHSQGPQWTLLLHPLRAGWLSWAAPRALVGALGMRGCHPPARCLSPLPTFLRGCSMCAAAHCRQPPPRYQSRGYGGAAPAAFLLHLLQLQLSCCSGCSRTVLKGPPTANRQLPPTANRHQPPTANRRQPPAATNRQPSTATNHPSPTANCRQPPPTAANCQLPTANRQSPPAANRQSPPTMVEHMSYTRSFLKKPCSGTVSFFSVKDRPGLQQLFCSCHVAGGVLSSQELPPPLACRSAPSVASVRPQRPAGLYPPEIASQPLF